jgi:enoyl-CoA hydratase/carnithine racemase
MFKLSTEGAIARLRLDRPEARNALPLAGWSGLADVAEEAERGGAHVLVLSGVPGGAFCAGADLADFHSFKEDPAARTAFRLAIRSGLSRLRALPIPTMAMIEGPCYGAGVAVAMACDLRFAGPGAQFAITPAKLGISYPQEDVHRLVGLVGAAQASRLLFSAEAIDGVEAARIGLVERFIADEFEGAVTSFAAAVSANDRASLATLKRGIRQAERGICSDPDQDRVFDDLLGNERLFARLEAHRSRRR